MSCSLHSSDTCHSCFTGCCTVWSVLCVLSSFPLRRVLSRALQQVCEWLLDQAVCLLSVAAPYIIHVIHSIVQNRSEKDLKRASSSLFHDK